MRDSVSDEADGPEVKGRRVIPQAARVKVSSPEAIIATTKAAELFILDLAMKTWQAKEFETDEERRISTELSLEDIKKAVRMHENFDFLEMLPNPK